MQHSYGTIGQDRRTMPCGSVFVVDRLRSAGPLTLAERQFCRSSGISLAFDPMQSGWITQDAIDDVCHSVDRPQPNAVDQARLKPLEPKQLMFRAWQMADAPVFLTLLDDPEVWRFLYEDYPGPMDMQSAQDLIAVANAANHHRVRAVVHEGQAVGQIRLDFSSQEARPELSYWIGRAHWGQGLGSEAVRLFSRESLRDDPSLEAITARAHRDNTASAKVLIKAGYQSLGFDRTAPDWQRFILRRQT